mmetsp:Transcript_158697/g.505213  ORF Transcript_158697/g.505213 Transcript_158697/m.505213 type:complete len:217 (-) Transcript_158697:569-1219(-)
MTLSYVSSVRNLWLLYKRASLPTEGSNPHYRNCIAAAGTSSHEGQKHLAAEKQMQMMAILAVLAGTVCWRCSSSAIHSGRLNPPGNAHLEKDKERSSVEGQRAGHERQRRCPQPKSPPKCKKVQRERRTHWNRGWRSRCERDSPHTARRRSTSMCKMPPSSCCGTPRPTVTTASNDLRGSEGNATTACLSDASLNSGRPWARIRSWRLVSPSNQRG